MFETVKVSKTILLRETLGKKQQQQQRNAKIQAGILRMRCEEQVHNQEKRGATPPLDSSSLMAFSLTHPFTSPPPCVTQPLHSLLITTSCNFQWNFFLQIFVPFYYTALQFYVQQLNLNGLAYT
jgi:hypothetical protein